MNQKNLILAAICLLIGSTLTYAVIDQRYQSRNNLEQYTPVGMHHMSNGSLMGNMEAGHMMLVTSEEDFISKMIPHHQEAVDTAKEVLERGATTKEIRELAENIITAQEAEIVAMKSWYLEWYGKQYENDGGYVPMMRDLKNLSGTNIDRIFLEDMIMHHMGAIMMARGVEPYVKHQQLSELTKAIVSSQSAEITQMRLILQEL